MQQAKSVLRFDINLVTVLFLGLISIAITFYLVRSSIELTLKQKVQSMALLIDPLKLHTLTATETDETNPVYHYYKKQFSHIKSANHEIKFLYLMKKNKDAVVFMVDSVEEGGIDYSPPGQVYTEATPVLINSLTNGASSIEIGYDRWGAWLSAFAPITDPKDGRVIAILGADVDAYSQYIVPIILYSSIPALIFTILVILVINNGRYAKLQRKTVDEKNAILHITSHEVHTPLTKIRWACENLLDAGGKGEVDMYKTLSDIYMVTIEMIERVNILNNVVAMSNNADLNIRGQSAISDVFPKAITKLSTYSKLKNIPVSSFVENDLQTQIKEDVLVTVYTTLLLNMIFYASLGTNVNVRCFSEGGYITHEFEGTGIGITKEDLKKVFIGMHEDVSFSSHTEATGLGLYFVHKIASIAKGSISVTSQNNTTRFVLKLPQKR